MNACIDLNSHHMNNFLILLTIILIGTILKGYTQTLGYKTPLEMEMKLRAIINNAT
jgi:hypothetical protein